MMTPTIIWTSFLLIVLGGKLVIDFYLIKHKKVSPKHGLEILIVIIVTMAHAAFIAKVHTPKNWVPDDYTLAVLFFYPSAWWALFDGVLNLMLGRKWFTIGETAWTDRQFQRAGMNAYVWSKAMAFTVMVICIIIIYTDFV